MTGPPGHEPTVDGWRHLAADIEVSGLGHAFDGPPPVTALKTVDLSVPAGAFMSLVGPSGCGKSTLLRILAGLLEPTSGVATIGSASTIGRPGLAAFMPQKDLLLPWRRAMGNAVLAAEIDGVPGDLARQQARPLFERFGLDGFADAWPSQLSGGMRQRLALLRTFLPDRAVLLLDEPFGALDAITRRRMYTWLQQVWLDDHRTVLFVTHDVEEAIYLSDEVAVMSERPGRVLATMTIDLPRPREPGLVTSPTFVDHKATLLAALDG